MNRFLRALCVTLWVGFAGWVATIFYLSSLSGPSVEELNVFHLWDKLAHFIAYAAGGVLLAGGLRAGTRLSPAKIFGYTLLALSLFGASDEWHQLYTPGRSGADVHDWLADTLGSAAGATLALVLWRVWFNRAAAPRTSALPSATVEK